MLSDLSCDLIYIEIEIIFTARELDKHVKLILKFINVDDKLVSFYVNMF